VNIILQTTQTLTQRHNVTVGLPERESLYSVTESSNLATTRLVVVSAAVDHDLLKLEVVHVLHVYLRRHCRHDFSSLHAMNFNVQPAQCSP